MSAILLVLTLLLQEKKPKLEFTATVEKVDGNYVFRVKGTTEIPDGTVLRARAYVLENSKDPQTGADIIDDEPILWTDEGFESFEVDKSAFHRDLHKFKRKPYSLPYRVGIDYDPEYQNNTIRKALGEEKIRWNFDFRVGDEAALGREKQAAAEELRADFTVLNGLFSDLKKEFADQQNKADARRWENFKAAIQKRVAEMNERNNERYSIWTVWIERQGKMRVEALATRIDDLLKHCSEILKGDNTKLAEAQKLINYFSEYYDESIEAVGIDMPLDIDTIAPAIAKYETALKPLRESAIKPKDKTWEEACAAARRTGSESLLTIAATLTARRKAYERLNTLMNRFTRILKLESADDLKKAFEEHDAALKDFKSFAGLK